MLNLKASKREAITTILTEVINNEEGVVFAYLYGSFVTDKFFNDIDSFAYPVKIKEKFFDAVAKAGIGDFVVDDFDVRIINEAPYDVVIDILREGRLLTDKESDFRRDYIERISDEYRVNHFILDEAYGEGR